MLRESSKIADTDIDLTGIAGTQADPGDIEAADLLVAFTERAVARDAQALVPVRRQIAEALGPDALVDVAATVAAFHGFVRVADATGIPYKEQFPGVDNAGLRAEVGIDDFYAAGLADRG